MSTIYLNNHPVGSGHPVYIIGEIGINHNGEVEIAKRLIKIAKDAGCDAVKFQKRTPELCVPGHQRDVLRETPWGIMTYMDYRYRVEFGLAEYKEIDAYCRAIEIQWFASAWDVRSVEFLEQFNPPCHKLPSALLTDKALIYAYAAIGRPVIISTGMSTMKEIREAAGLVAKDKLLLAHCTSIYPCPPDKLNLRMINTLKKEFDNPVGYSCYEVGLSTTYAAVVLGADFVERHITLDRAMWGSDQAASVEPGGLKRLVENIRDIEASLGDGVKRVYDEESVARGRLRVVSTTSIT